MEVQLVAHTRMPGPYYNENGPWNFTPYTRSQEPNYYGSTDADELAEFAGRLCYESWDRPNPATATNSGYLGNILDHAHYSVLEHASATFYIAGVSRTLTHELVRHRHLSYSQVSQRYVSEENRPIVIPPTLQELAQTDSEAAKKVQELLDLDAQAKALYSSLHELLVSRGSSKKEARSCSRAALLASQSTAIVVTGNMHAWREVIAKRSTPYADVEIRQLAQMLLRELKVIAANAFQDME